MKTTYKNVSQFKTIEFIVYLVIWMAVFSFPFFKYRDNGFIMWDKVILEWVRIIAFLIIFILNIIVLVPRLLFFKKYRYYFIFTFFTIILIISASIAIQNEIEVHSVTKMPPMEIGPGMPPMELSSSMPAPMGYRPNELTPKKSIFTVIADYFIISLLLVGASTALRIMLHWVNEEKRRKDIEQEQLKTELALLRHQVSPHFLMNTLNNIHALIDLNVDVAKDAVIKLSILMRYLLYDSAHGVTTLSKELEFMGSYIELMKLRYNDNIDLRFNIPNDIPELKIPPMLFISFLENAFKHGVSYKAKSYIFFDLEIIDGLIVCTIKNSKHIHTNNVQKKYSGIGITNVCKNLELLYDDNYDLEINDKVDEFEVKLKIPPL
jgi:hypothetical protein